MRKSLWAQRPFLLLLALFITGVWVQQAALPVMEGGDEALHTIYALLLHADNHLPDRTTSRTNATRQESGQPPLTYWVGAVFLRLANVPSQDVAAVYDQIQTARNPWLTPPDGWSTNDNLNTYLHTSDEAFFTPAITRANRVLRLTALGFALLAVLGAYGAASEVFDRRAWALVAAALFAFTPMLLHLASYFNNDISVTAFSTLAIWQTLSLLRRGASARRCLVIGLLLALAGLSKVSGLLVAPGVGIALLLEARRHQRPLRQLLINGMFAGIPLLLFLPWVLYGLILYNDPIGFRTHSDPNFRHDPLLAPWETLPYMPEIYLSYWGKFGMAKIYLTPIVYTALGVIPLLALTGYAVCHPRQTGWRAQQWLVAGIISISLLAGLVRWLQELFFITGRLMYPAHITMILLLTLGLQRFASRWSRLAALTRLYAAGMIVFAGLVITPFTLYQAFAPPPALSRHQLPVLSGGPLDFDESLRFLGYSQASPVIRGPIHTVTLCWEVLQAASRPAAFSLKFVREGVIVADRTSIHGMGRYPAAAWQPGVIFCDAVAVPLDDPDVPDDPLPEPAQRYDMLLVLLNAETLAVDWQAATADGTPVEYPIIGQVVSPAGDLRSRLTAPLIPAPIEFPGFARLQGYTLDGALQPGQTVRLALLWSVTGTTDTSQSQFIHLMGTDTALILADRIPRQGDYPTWAWSPGEMIVDNWTLTLPDHLAPGDYTIRLGFYRQDTGERMAVMQTGMPATDNSAVLLTFRVAQPST